MTEDLINQFQKTKPGDLGIFGDPVEHSLSPAMHNASFDTWKNVLRDRAEDVPVFHKFLVKEGQLREAFALVRKYKLRGVNVTVPHKVAAVSLMDKLQPFAQKVGAINTVIFEDGKLEGHNTDGYGFRFSLEADLAFEPADQKILLLGAGGTGRVMAYQLQQENAGKIFWWNRNRDKLRGLLDEIGKDLPCVEQISTEEEIRDVIGSVDLVINATSVGLNAGDGMPAGELLFRPGQCVFDVIYNRTTKFMEQARSSGAIVTGGLGMLLYQGVQGFRLWTGKPAPVELMRLALSNSLKEDKQ